MRPATDQPSWVAGVSNLAASNEMDDLDLVAVGERRGRPQRARNDGQIAFDGDLPLIQTEERHQSGNIPRRRDLALFSVDGQPHAASL